MSSAPISVTAKAPLEYIPVMDPLASPMAHPEDDASVPMAGAVDMNGLVLGRWKTDIFSCLADLMPNCLMATFCPCISLAQVLHRLGFYSYSSTLIAFGILYTAYLVATMLSSSVHQACVYNGIVVTCTSSWNPWPAVSLLLAGVMRGLLMHIRTRVRGLFQIPGSAAEDCLCAFCCSCCMLAQLATHTDAYTAAQCEFGPKDTLPGYHA
ncbi:hypothetical protein SPRG_15575 [Saprolegnia parasitica CBS 223.65]|uniref:PLAC8 family protein n=1 Tax=Saprolegnia parasitica (strain CBS 223.65) TaxID=695850 RepID=A0A067BXQ8_SAPPC|nr:hypothetical protein SPRG_15575 [Saprolegnia parasitica CBS 223.65]KDO19096.1 hypothetical protein SPRG_15575 [Saprolegnia parasitica CBS 223.65]|eukprot:XP_012210199.1 hypothetical protein SPRG_15575 [Saprolegnia parasitica CBS 223.65]